MKKTLTLLAILIATTLFAQNTYVPDDNFEQVLIDLGYDSGALDNFVPTANISGITSLDVSNKNIADLTGIQDFTALVTLNCENNSIQNLNLTTLTNLENLYCSHNLLSNYIDVSQNTTLKILYCGYNSLSIFDLSQNLALERLSCYVNQLSTLDVSVNTALVSLKCQNNQLTELNVKNGANTNIPNANFITINNSNLTCIEVDDAAWSTTNWTNIDAMASFNDVSCNPQTYVPDDNFEQALIDLGYDSGALDDYVPTVNISGVTYLDVSSKNIVDLTGIEDFTSLSVLLCNNNQLTSLNISNNVALTQLFCVGNSINKLDLTNNTVLSLISCSNNQLTNLNVKNGNNTNITNNHFFADGNANLTCIEVDDATWSSANWTNIDATASFNETACTQMTYVPDDNFEQALIDLGLDSGTLDNVVPTANISGVTYLSVHSKNIANLRGIEDFTALTELRCNNNQLISLDVSNNTALTILYCSTNQLTSLDVTTNTALTELYCYFNQLTNLDVSNNTALTKLSCTFNELTSLDISNNTALTILYCSTNQLTGLDISNNTALTNLQCYSNQITSLDLTSNTALTELYCYSNQITSLNVKNGNNINMSNVHFKATSNPNLTCIEVDDGAWSTTNWTNIDATASFSEHCVGGIPMTYVPDENFEQALIDLGYDSGALDDYVLTANINSIATLDVSNKNIADLTGIQDFVTLTELHCIYNQLTSLDLYYNTSLNILNCNNNQLTSLNISNNSTLTELYCAVNQLTSLDVSNNTGLTQLIFFANELTSLDVSNNTALTQLNGDGNKLTSLDVTNNTALTLLRCSFNELTQLNVKNGNNTNMANANFDATNNPNLTCILVDDATYSTTNWTNIDATSTFVNNQAECDALSVADNTFETQLSLYPNPVKNSFTVQNNSNYTIENLSIYTILGKLVLQTSNVNAPINVSPLKNGVYLVKLTSDSKTAIQKIIINN